MKTGENPFEGLKRKRLPSMHMITALDGGVPLHDALAGFFFMMMHDKIPHSCLIKAANEKHKESVSAAVSSASSPDGAAMAGIFGAMGNSALAGEEWSYISYEDAFIFYLIADTAIEQVQRWICEGGHKPMNIPLGDLVQRPQWAIEYFSRPERQKEEVKALVRNLQEEIEKKE